MEDLSPQYIETTIGKKLTLSKKPMLSGSTPFWVFNHGPIYYDKSFLTGKKLTFDHVQQEHYGNYTCYYEESDLRTNNIRYYIAYVEIKVIGMYH